MTQIDVPRSIIFIELPNQIGTALKAARKLGFSNCTLLALTPHVGYALQKLGLQFGRPEDYHTTEELDAVGLEDLATLDTFFDVVDNSLHKRWSLLKEHRVRPASMNWYFVKILFNTVSIRAFILRRMLEKELPDHIGYFDTKEESIGRDLNFERESAWSRLIPVASNSVEISHTILGNGSDPSVLGRCPSIRQGSLKNELKSLGRRYLAPSLVRFVRAGFAKARNVAGPIISSSRNIAPTSVPNLLTVDGQNYNLDRLFQQITANKSFNILSWDGLKLRPPLNTKCRGSEPADAEDTSVFCDEFQRDSKDLLAEVMAGDQVRRLFWFSGMDCFPVMKRRLQRLVEVDIPETVRGYFKALELLDEVKPTAVITSTMVSLRSQASSVAARNKGVPFIVYRHGSSGGFQSWPNYNIERLELPTADYVLGYGEGDVQYIDKRQRGYAKVIPIGSSVLDQLRKPAPPGTKEKLLSKFGLDPKKRTVMFVPNDMDGNVRVSPHRGRPPSEMFEEQRRIVEVFEEFPDIQFVVKLKPSPNQPCSPVASLINDRRMTNCVVIAHPFIAVLPMADMFIMDIHSTSLLEALTTERPILFCGDQLPDPWGPGNCHPSMQEMWNERIAYACDMEEFLELLRTYLKEERFEPVKSADRLLKLFGTHLDDGRSAERASAFLESLI